MNPRIGTILSLIAACLVLFFAMLDPTVSAGLTISLFIIFSAYQFMCVRNGNDRQN